MTVLAVLVLTAMVGAAVLRGALTWFVSPETLHADIHGLGAYVAVIGGLYSIIMAFLIYVVWEQWNRVVLGVAHEAAAVEDLCRVASFLSERDAGARIRAAARQYLRTTAGDEPGHLARGRASALAHDHFLALCHAVRSADTKTEKDGVVYAELLSALRRVLQSRDERLSVSGMRIPSTLWCLVVFGACALLAGFMVLGVRSTPLAIGVVAGVAGILTFLLAVIRDMDNPFQGVWNVSYDPMTTAVVRVA